MPVLLEKRKKGSGRMCDALEILQKKDNGYTEEEKKQFQLFIVCSYLILHSMYGKDIVMNYWHMLSSGHILWFMNRLHKLWEALNRLMKGYVSWHTNMGGGCAKTKSKLKPVANLFL